MKGKSLLWKDPRFNEGLKLFNSRDWYSAHDLFEELWFESIGQERSSLQGILQIAVAQVHLDKGNRNGAAILYGEGLGRLRSGLDSIELGLDIQRLIECVEARLSCLQSEGDPHQLSVPILLEKSGSYS